jgi:eukaryotic-like serine/threonine-protein kinase
MPLTAGSRLGAYEILSALGAGGMGEVYRARDPRLGRDVAIKILPPAASADLDRLRRFEQEARAAAALNHPNILAVYDIGSESATTYVVSELLNGQTLRDVLAETGALPARRAIDYGIQIAKGLAAAHDKSIVHRDLKPENLFVTADGRVKILDFGLAKLTEAAAAAGSPAYSASGLATAPPPTDPGVVLGTVGYMSPEQVRSRAVDHRSDIFSFGAVMYEMVSGRRAFVAESPAETMTAIVRSDPPELSTSGRAISPALDRVVSRCLEKSPEARFQSAKDLAFALEAVSTSSQLPIVEHTLAHVTARERLAWLLAGLFAVAAAAAAAAALMTRPTAVDRRVLRYTVSPPERIFLPPGANTDTVSPDGRRIAFLARRDTPSSIWIRDLDSFAARVLPGTENANTSPFWSPDSRFVGFFSSGARTLKKVDAAGGPPILLCDLPTGVVAAGGTWSAAGVILIGTISGSVYRVSDQGGVPTPVTAKDPARNETGHRGPQFLPDGRHFLFFASGPNEVNLASLDGPQRSVVLHADSRPTYVPSGRLLFVRQGTLLAQAFDTATFKVSGEAIPIAEGVLNSPATNTASFSASTDVLVYRTGRATAADRLTWFTRSGQPAGTVGDPGDYRNPRLSPDGSQLVVEARKPGSPEIWIRGVNRGTSTRLTVPPSSGQQPVWSPDGLRVVYSVGQPGPGTLTQKMASGIGGEEALLKLDGGGSPDDWTPDGRGLLYHTGVGVPPVSLMLLPLAGDRKPLPVVESSLVVIDGRFSPDGKWLAYVSTESGRPEVYLQNFPTATAKWPVSAAGGIQPVWRRDGRELFYIAADSTLMAVTLTLGSTPQIGAPHPLFQTRIAGGGTIVAGGVHHQYDVTADGQKFLVLTAGDTEDSPFNVVVNWQTALKK